MTLRHLKIFVAVCEQGSVTAAGEQLYIAQPSVSLAIADLEQHYGVKLFDRISKRLYITEAGKSLFQYAQHILGLFADMENGMKSADSTGILRVGTSITIGTAWLPQYVKTFQSTHPHMQIRAVIDNSTAIEQHILSNRIDIGLIEGIVHSPYIAIEPFMEDELVLLAGANHPLAASEKICLAQLQIEDFILREKGSAGREIFDGILAGHSIEITPIWESVSTQAILKAVSAGLGLSVLPYLLVKDSVERGEIVLLNIPEISLRRHFSVLYHKNKFLTPALQDFIDLCKHTGDVSDSDYARVGL